MRFEADENEILIHKENPGNHLVAIRYNAIANEGKLPESVKEYKAGYLVFPFAPEQKYEYEIGGHIPSSIQEVSVKLNERDIKDKPANISGKIAIKYTIPVPRVEFISEEDEISELINSRTSFPNQHSWFGNLFSGIIQNEWEKEFGTSMSVCCEKELYISGSGEITEAPIPGKLKAIILPFGRHPVPLLHYCMSESIREPSRGSMQQVGGYLPRTRKGDLTNGDYSEETDLGEALSCEQFTEIWQKINRGNKVRYVKLTFNGEPDEDAQSGLQREVTVEIKMEGDLHSIFHPEYDTSSFLKIRGNNTFVLNSFRGARGKRYENSFFVRVVGTPMTLVMDVVALPYHVWLITVIAADGGPR